jgi:hypothetical protein
MNELMKEQAIIEARKKLEQWLVAFKLPKRKEKEFYKTMAEWYMAQYEIIKQELENLRKRYAPISDDILEIIKKTKEREKEIEIMYG